MKKRVLSLLIVLCLVLSLVPAVSAEEATSGTCGENLTWRQTEESGDGWVSYNLYIEGDGDMYDYQLDENGNSTAPWSGLYFNNVTVDEDATSIGSYAFYGCDCKVLRLESSNVSSIGMYAFAESTLSSITLPAGLTTLDEGLFFNADDLTSVSIPDSMTTIGDKVFSGTAVEELLIPETVTSVGANAFAGMTGPIYFMGDAPAFVPETDESNPGTFTGYTGIIYYPADDPAWTDIIAQNTYGEHTWTEYVPLTGTCGENLTWTLKYRTLYIDGEGDMYDYTWDDHAPWYELTFDSLVLGSDVTSIGNYAFRSCDSLRSTNLGESHVTRIGVWAFGGSGITNVEVPYGVTELENCAFYGTQMSNVVLPESLVRIGHGVFAFSNAGELIIPSSVQSMGDAVFEYSYTKVRFIGDPPEFTTMEYEDAQGTFGLFKGTIYYPANNPAWTEDITTVVNGWYTWVPYILNPFTDVPEDSFYYDPVMWAIEHNITNGLTEETFGPTATCNRAQVVTFLWRAAGSPEPTTTENPFVDVQAGSFYEKPVLWAVEKGITNGSDATHFNPNGVCNRAQVVTFLYRAFGSPAVENAGNPFTDVPAGSFYEAPVLWAVENGITNGLSATTFGPSESCNRAQVVTFLYRAYND